MSVGDEMPDKVIRKRWENIQQSIRLLETDSMGNKDERKNTLLIREPQ